MGLGVPAFVNAVPPAWNVLLLHLLGFYSSSNCKENHFLFCEVLLNPMSIVDLLLRRLPLRSVLISSLALPTLHCGVCW